MGFISCCNDQSRRIEALLKTNDSIYDGFNFAENMINREHNETKTILIICQSTVSYNLFDYVCNYFLCTIK